jgi:hypothetical protein
MKKPVVALVFLLLAALAGWFALDRARAPKTPSPVAMDGDRVCLTQATLGSWNNDGPMTFAHFAITDALQHYNQRAGVNADSMRAISLELTPATISGPAQIDLAGESVAVTLQGGQKAAAVFPGQRLRSHSTITAIITRDRSAFDLNDIGEWKLCGQPYDDPDVDWRAPVANQLDGFTVGPGVNVMGGEYACVQGWGLHHHTAAGVTHQELAEMLDAWQVRTVRLPVNEHCWLADTEGFDQLNPAFTGAAYRESVKALIDLLTLAPYNMRVVLDLHWTGTREEQALDLKPLPDREFAARFWRSAANTFADNSSVMFNLFNEPHVPRGLPSGSTAFAHTATDTSASRAAAALGNEQLQRAQDQNWWAHWRDGYGPYAGMQALVDAIRETGAGNHIVIGGLDFAGDLRGWGSYAPVDPQGKLWADNHAYPAGEKCRTRACWQRTLLPLMARGYGVMFGETGNSVGQYPQGCAADFVKHVYRFAREYQIPALGWTFLPGGTADPDTNEPRENSCQIPSLITRWPGELVDGGDLSDGEVRDKRSFDPTPNDWSDDATWAGCAALAYLFDRSLDDNDLPDQDPRLSGAGNCSAALGLSIPGR